MGCKKTLERIHKMIILHLSMWFTLIKMAKITGRVFMRVIKLGFDIIYNPIISRY